MTPKRIQRKWVKGWKMPTNTVSVCRPGKFGNPFIVGVDGTAQECVEKFAKDIGFIDSRLAFDFEDIKTELAGKNLACWCKKGDYCHADVLLELANT